MVSTLNAMCINAGSVIDQLNDLGQISKCLCFSLLTGQVAFTIMPNSEAVTGIIWFSSWKALKAVADTWQVLNKC